MTSEKHPVLMRGHTLDIDSITHRYGHVTAVADVSLGVRAGEIVALLGPSGCGKTTLLRVVAGFVRQTAGSVRIDGNPIDHLPANQRNVVTIPVITPGIAAGAFLAFVASLDNVPVSLFLAGPRSDKLPIRRWGMMESMLDVRVAAVSGVLIAAVIVLMLVMERVVGLTRRLRD